ncbi:MAG: TIGR00730 family Rossman fold protein [Proteobacteria bacterium]|nr:MAG: TIGR00730 family Rossman fold protein [Pseudomonadota bacterium]
MTTTKDFTPVGSNKETEFLEGPSSRWKEIGFLFKVMSEFIYGFRKLHFTGPCVTVFGSARFKEDHPYYILSRRIGQEIAKLGFTVITGGGPGIMEAANRGAKDVGGRSIGCNIILPSEQSPNKYLDKWVDFDFFFVRKTLLSKYSYAFVVMPGGYGTLDEFFEALTLIQTGKFRKFPIVLMGKEYHQDLYRHLQRLADEKTVDPADLNLFLFTDSIEEAIGHITTYAIEGFGLKKRKKMKTKKFLGE